MFRASRFCIRASKTGEALARCASGATLKYKIVSCGPGEVKKKHPGGREILFFSEIFFLMCNLRIILYTMMKTVAAGWSRKIIPPGRSTGNDFLFKGGLVQKP